MLANRRSLNFALTLNLVLVAFAVCIIVGGMRIKMFIDWRIGEINSTISALVNAVAGTAGEAAFRIDPILAERSVQGLIDSRYVRSVSVVDDFGTVLFTFAKPDEKKDNSGLAIPGIKWNNVRSISLIAYGSSVGRLVVDIDDREVNDELHSVINAEVANILVILVALAISFALVFYLTLTRPLSRLARTLSEFELESRYFKRVVPPKGHELDEIGSVAENFNTLLSKIEKEIHQLHRTKDELGQLRLYLSSIINSMPSALVSVDNECIITHWNKQAEKNIGILASEAVGRHLESVVPRMAPVVDLVRKAVDERKVYLDSHQHRREDGELLYDEITIYPLTADGVDGAVIRVDDVTDRTRLEMMMVQSEKMMSVGGLAAGMAHEINNPLAGVLGHVHNMRKRIFGDLKQNEVVAEECGLDLESMRCYMERRDILRMLDGIFDSGNRAAAIVANMLTFSRKSEKRHDKYDLAKLLDSTIELAANDYDLKKHYDFRKIEINREYDSDIPNVVCEGTELQQVFFNLLKNGAEAMMEKDFINENPRFICRIKKEFPMVLVEIEDNGPGMDMAIRKRIFEPFYTTKEVGKGTGLGLSVSYFIIKNQHGGELEVDSSFGNWTKFTVKLPLKNI
ncbi:ATP-binding protein [Maridesulfovibrio sp.]|uniref:ATP-binding protein n=1 Tax=Maridesulfovibrio sp. TaxID=2795000 RepID=UPI0029F50A6E|nr:ATP-binding protein [Maridesulfovibrio sp.]